MVRSRRTRSVVLALALGLATSAASAEEVEVSEQARQHFRTGVALLTDPDGARYEEAYNEFKAAYADSPSWKILGNLGISAMKLERDGEAIDAFEKYLAGGGDQIDPAERAQMERDLMTTRSGVVWLTLKAQPGDAPVAIFDERQPLTGRAVNNRYDLAPGAEAKIGVRRGRHKIVARRAGYADAVWELDATPGAELQHEFVLEVEKAPEAAPAPSAPAAGPAGPAAAPVMERPIGVPVIIGAAATGALLVGGGVVGFLAMGKKSDYDAKNDGSDVEAAKSLRDSGQSLNLVADVLLGAGVVAGAVTTYLFLSRPEVPASGPATASLRVSPVVAPGVGAFVATGRF